MATERYYICDQCNGRTYPPTLFKALLEFSRSAPKCGACGTIKNLHLKFSFGLGAGEGSFKVLGAFLPPDLKSWRDDGREVTYHPFLVVLEGTEKDGCSFWFPYWHIVEGGGATKKTKYGQWAPLIDDYQFDSLIAQAREKGFLPR
jgi:hypothetical protein